MPTTSVTRPNAAVAVITEPARDLLRRPGFPQVADHPLAQFRIIVDLAAFRPSPGFSGSFLGTVRPVCPPPAVPGDLPRHHRRIPPDRGGYVFLRNIHGKAAGYFFSVGQCEHFPAHASPDSLARSPDPFTRGEIHSPEIPYLL